ncbi:MAG: sporulation protein YabP [Clostridia bacterium]|nr:sporulation protein YabP [Clostridia bacterium]
MNEAGTALRLRSHSVHMEDRSRLSITGVTEVGCFNEHEVVISTEAGGMLMEGAGLHITKLDLEEGQIIIEGEICAIEYEDEPPAKKGSLLSRMFR